MVATFDLDKCRRDRVGWGLFRDRRPELYGALLTLDGKTVSAAVGGGRGLPAGAGLGPEAGGATLDATETRKRARS